MNDSGPPQKIRLLLIVRMLGCRCDTQPKKRGAIRRLGALGYLVAPASTRNCGRARLPELRCVFRLGSIASLWPSAHYFRSSPANGRPRGQRACLKSARTGPSLPAFSRSQATLGTPNAPTAAVLSCPTGPGLLARRLPRDRRMIVGPPGTTFGVGLVAFRPIALFDRMPHVLVWSIQYWPSVRYCGMNCPTDRRVPSTLILRL